MDNKTKWLLFAGVAGVGLWWWMTQGSANASLAAHIPPVPPVPPAPGPQAADQVQTPAVTTSGGTVAISNNQAAVTAQGQMVAALLKWAQQTQNPALYIQMIDQASASDIAGLYNLLTTYWAGATPGPTPAQTLFWNNLRNEYPFLNTAGAGCTNLACN